MQNLTIQPAYLNGKTVSRVVLPPNVYFHVKNRGELKTAQNLGIFLTTTKKEQIGEYQEQAKKFLKDNGITFEVTFEKSVHFEVDKKTKKTKFAPRDYYTAKFTKGLQVLTINEFGQSIVRSSFGDIRYDFKTGDYTATKGTSPTAYDILACLTKSNPGTFENFCGDFGYNEDSRKAEKVYNAVTQEYLKVTSFFTAQELEALQDIN